MSSLRSVLQTSMLNNNSLPATDSGFVTTNQTIPNMTSNSWFSMDNGLFALILFGCMLGYLLTSGRNKNKQSTLKKDK
jgi:hypothetical protein